jgi:hypothetical protein
LTADDRKSASNMDIEPFNFLSQPSNLRQTMCYG